jgi:peroxiredoxin
LGHQPVVVIFIKRDCPCSTEFEPFFQRLERAYRGSARFIGVIDGDVATARQFVTDHHTPYPVLADPDLRIICRFEAEHGSYVALVGSDGAVAALWPGISASMMQELSGQIARLANVPEQIMDTSNMPKAMMTGCPYLKEE